VPVAVVLVRVSVVMAIGVAGKGLLDHIRWECLCVIGAEQSESQAVSKGEVQKRLVQLAFNELSWGPFRHDRLADASRSLAWSDVMGEKLASRWDRGALLHLAHPQG
jgi:hypothetical protein